ncbi:hypothetical protein FB446DRAFT_759653 [Lentinula raphanica]|nr:hypothetical protein FB446DRAFT_759653 [Lentinula raphanica]
MRFHHLVFFGVLLAVLAFAAPVPLQARTSPSLVARRSEKPEITKCEIEYYKGAVSFSYQLNLTYAESVMEDTVKEKLGRKYKFAEKTKDDPVFHFEEHPSGPGTPEQAALRIWVKKDGKTKEYKEGKLWISTDVMDISEEPEEPKE